MSSDIQFTEKVRLDHYNPDEVTNAIRLDEAAHPVFVSETYCPTNFSTYTCNFLVGPIADRLYAYEHLGFTPVELETIIAEHKAYKTMERARTLCGRRMGKTLMMNAERDFQRKLIGKWVTDPKGEPTEIPRVKLKPVDIPDGLRCVSIPDEWGEHALEKDDLVIFPITIKEKEKKTMNKNFTKADLKVGYVVKTRARGLFMVAINADEKLVLADTDQRWVKYDDLNDDLTHGVGSTIFDNTVCKNYDIVEVYGYSRYNRTTALVSTENRPLLWKREEPKEMTLEEVEKALGYPVKIINK